MTAEKGPVEPFDRATPIDDAPVRIAPTVERDPFVRTAEDRTRGIFRITVGGIEKAVPVLKIAASDRWVQECGEKVGPIMLSFAAEESVVAFKAFTSVTSAALLDLVIAYDQTSALGGRDWLEENAEPEELYTALRQMARNALPQLEGVGFLVEVLTRVEAVLKSLKSPTRMSGRSPTGDGLVTRLRRGLTATR